MAASGAFSLCLLILVTLVICIQGHEEETVPAASNVEQYLQLSKRQFLMKIYAFEAEIKAFNETHHNLIKPIVFQAQESERAILVVEDKLNSRVLIQPETKQCIRTYSPRIPTIYEVRARHAKCVVSASERMNKYLEEAMNTMNGLQHYYAHDMVDALNSCSKQFDEVPENYTHCVTEVIAQANKVTFQNEKTFRLQIEQAKCLEENGIVEALDCSFSSLYNTIFDLGKAQRMIDSCSSGNDDSICPPCSKVETCPVVVKQNVDKNYFQMDSINNLFIGMNHSIPCVQVDIIPSE